jgi:MoaA/NifB/PqqE/SkfB family radical SAM enzyme
MPYKNLQYSQCITNTLFLIVFPPDRHNTAAPLISAVAKQMLNRVLELAKKLHPAPCLILWDPSLKSGFNLMTEQLDRIKGLCKWKKRIVVANIGFLLQPVDRCASFLNQGNGRDTRIYGDISSGEILAADFPIDRVDHMTFHAMIRFLARTRDEIKQPPPEFINSCQIFKPPVSCGNSRLFSSIKKAQIRPHPMSSTYLNTAYREIIYTPVHSFPPSDGYPNQLVLCLKHLEKESEVPWIFNTLSNEVEYIAGKHELTSFPPEIHISVAGCCNIECKFCTYEHMSSRPAYMDIPQMSNTIPFARIHTLRLTSGLGEPTLNPRLAEIIRWIGVVHPHIVMNFFTNGLMLKRPDLVSAIVEHVRWINISLNAATPAVWQRLCGRDMYNKLLSSVKYLNSVKACCHSLLPVLHGSMVLNSINVHELPKMPQLCHRLGIDKFTVIPFYSMNMHSLKKLNDLNTLEYIRHQYDALYEKTVLNAQNFSISIELPRSSRRLSVRFGLEERDFYDFRGIGEPLPYSIHRLLPACFKSYGLLKQCPDLWRQILISHTYGNHEGFNHYTHFRYPCLGPMCYLDFSTISGILPGSPGGLQSMNNHWVFKFLRKAQFQLGANPVCDLCRGIDSRNPRTHDQFLMQLNEWQQHVIVEN